MLAVAVGESDGNVAPQPDSHPAMTTMAARPSERTKSIKDFRLLRRQQRPDHLIKSLHRWSLLQPLAIDKESRCGIDTKGVAGARALGRDLIQKFLIRQTLIKAFLGKAGLLRDIEQLRHRASIGKGPVLLLRVKRLDQGECFVISSA